MNNNKSQIIYLIRHATPDWNRKDIPYDIPPGPPLVIQGENEAAQLGAFLKKKGVRRMYFSPLERAKQTAEICAKIANVEIKEENGIAEWRTAENEKQLSDRFFPVWDRVVQESQKTGPIALVSHGGPIRLLLQKLGLPDGIMEKYRGQFDHGNPLPPAGIWKAEKSDESECWDLSLVFIPNAASSKKTGITS